MKAYLELTKPRITWLILMSTAVGYFFGRRAEWQPLVLLHTLLGVALMASGTAALNEWFEREADARMRRTANRPIPSGRVTPRQAFWFGCAISLAGFWELWLGTNALAACCGLATLGLYLGIYTPLKSRTVHATTLGAIPGAMPPLIGFAAAHGALTREAGVLFLVLFLWQFPHFWAIGWMYRDDYARGGIRMLPVIDPDGRRTAAWILVGSLLLAAAGLLPAAVGMAGGLYWGPAALLGGWMIVAAAGLARRRSAQGARRVLRASVIYLPVLYALMLASRRGW